MRAVLLVPLLLLAAPASARDIAPIATHEVVTAQRTLRGLPLKRIITTRAGWDRLVDGLEKAPPAPDFETTAALLVVADESAGARARLGGVTLRDDGAVSVVLHREEPATPDLDAPANVHAFILILPAWPGGAHLDHRTQLPGGGGSISRPTPPAAGDREPKQVPSLGPDLRLSWVMADGRPVPAGLEVLLRREARFKRADLAARIHTDPFPAPTGLAFPRFRDDVSYIWAAHGAGVRSRNALQLKALPADGPDGHPRPIKHEFVLEGIHDNPVQGPRR